MKRSAQLAPLSRDHHVALVVARALSRAVAADAATAAGRFVDFMADQGLEHFALEEAVLLPFVPGQDRGRLLANRMLNDHEHLRDVWRRARAAPGEVPIEQLHALGSRLREHVRMEENELFPYLEESLDAAVLDEIGARLQGGPASLPPPPADVLAAQRFSMRLCPGTSRR
jgi:hemerythrin-like domain-containing protein